MNETIEFFNTVRQEPTLAGKISLLKAHRSDFYDEIVRDAMDKSVTYGITSKGIEIVVFPEARAGDDWYAGFHEILNRLATRELSGNAAIDEISGYIHQWPEEVQAFLLKVLDRDLNLGIRWANYCEEVMGIEEQYEVALAQHLEKVKGVNPVDGTYYASRKLDGCRLIAIIRDGEVEFRSRQNKPFTTLDNLKADVARFVSPLGEGEWVLDGEICKMNENGDEDFQGIMKEVRKKDHSIESCCYNVFDVLSYSEFKAGKSSAEFSKRLGILYRLNVVYAQQEHGNCWVKPLRQERLTSQADFDRWAGYVEAGNWEGFMLRKDVPYQSGRTKDLLKVKKFFDAEYKVEGVEVGEMSTAMPGQGIVKYQGVTRLVIDHKGNKVGVGSGMSREQRIAWMEDPSQIVGKTITVKYFEETKSQDGKFSLRFPTLKFVYENGRTC